MQRRFVILTLQRSGSNMLRSLLGAHPEITCFGELMRGTPKGMRSQRYGGAHWLLQHLMRRMPRKMREQGCGVALRTLEPLARSTLRRTAEQGYRGALRALEHVDPKFQVDALRFAYPHAFLDEVVAKLAPTPVTGFKLMLSQHPQFMSELIRDPDCAKVFLYRANHLASFSSHKIAKATGQGAANRLTKVKRAKVRFCESEFRHFMQRRKRLSNNVRKQLAMAGGSHLEIEYLDLVDGDAVPRVLEFLDVDPTCEVKPQSLRRNPSNLLERFENPADVQAALASMGLEHWSTEQPAVAGRAPDSADRRNLCSPELV